jgi:uncharacterized protein YbaP (TraB family)
MKKFFLIPVMVILASAAFAQNPVEKTGSLLWKISGNGLKTPSYIFGTHHLFSASFLDSVPGVKRAFAASEQMAGEIVMNDMAALAAEMQKAGMMPPDSTWQMLLSEDDYRFVDERLTASLGVGLQAFGMVKPIMVSTAYTMVVYQKIIPQLNQSDIMDIWLQQQSVSRGIPVIGLETIHDQTASFFIQSLKRQAADLLCMLHHVELVEDAARRLNRLYRSADLTGLAEMLREESPCPMSAEFEAAINDARNRRWVEKLPAIMSEKSTFVAVGTLHLAGAQGILAGLEKLGYTVEAVKN